MKETEDNQTAQVVLEQAFVWRCSSCGHENFSKQEVLPLSPDEKRHVMAQAEGIDVDDIPLTDEQLEAIPFQCSPQHVTCSVCELTFEAAPFRDVDLLTGEDWEG